MGPKSIKYEKPIRIKGKNYFVGENSKTVLLSDHRAKPKRREEDTFSDSKKVAPPGSIFSSDNRMENRDNEPPLERPLPEQQVPPMMTSSTTRSSLLQELQIIWDEIGESYNERDKMLLELENECLDIYNKKVEKIRKYRAELQKLLVEVEAEISSFMSALGEQFSFARKEGSLKDQISTVKPVFEDLLMQRNLRWKELSETLTEIAEISSNIAGNDYPDSSGPEIDESDLTQIKLDELRGHLQELRNEKAVRLQTVNSYINDVYELSEIMSFDLSEALSNVHKSLNGFSKSISNDTLARLTELAESLKKEKHQRLLQVQGFVRTMHKMWKLMETPMDERRRFHHISSLLSVKADDALKKGCLSLEIVREAEDEVKRLNVLKSSKMKELEYKKLCEVKEEIICREVHTAEQPLPGIQVPQIMAWRKPISSLKWCSRRIVNV